MLTEIEFYDRLAEYFDVMTDWQGRLAVELPFIEKLFAAQHVHSVLDCACGTGGHAIALAQRGYRVTGADISPTMIARAQANAQHAGLAVPFDVARFQDLGTSLNQKFDALLCLGNSFVHVLSDEDALASLQNMRACLRPGGVVLMHNLNYDKRWKDKPRWFAVNAGVLNGQETLVWRFADYLQSQITFNIALFTKNDSGAWSMQVQSTSQRPYQQSELDDLLLRAGFHDLEFYGDLQGAPFDAAQSGDLVIVAFAI